MKNYVNSLSKMYKIVNDLKKGKSSRHLTLLLAHLFTQHLTIT